MENIEQKVDQKVTKSSTFRLQKKHLLVILVVVSILILVPFIISKFRTAPSETGEKSRQPVEGSSIDTTYLSDRILTWLNSMRDSTGRYHYDESCLTVESCTKADVDNRVGLIAMWGRFKRYEKSQKPEELAEVLKDIDTYSDESIVNVIQTDHWACRLMYEMWQSDVFNAEQKDKIQSMCARSQDFLLQNTDPAQSATDDFVLQDMVDIMDGKSTEGLEPLTEDARVMLIRFATSVSNFTTRKNWFEKDIFYRIALIQFKQALFVFSNNREGTWEVAPLLGIAALDMYKINGNVAFLNFATYMQANTNEEPCQNVEFCMYQIALENELHRSVEEDYYHSKALTKAEQLVFNSFDDGLYDGRRLGKGVFYHDFAEKNYFVLENSILLGLLNSL